MGGFAKRIDLTTGGGIAALATGYRPDGTDTSADTVQWYRGQNDAVDPSDPTTIPREQVRARIDRDLDVGYGVRANEEGLRAVVQNLAILVSDTFQAKDDLGDDTLYRPSTSPSRAVRVGLSFEGSEGPVDIQSQVAIAGRAVESMRVRNITTRSTIEGVITDTRASTRTGLLPSF